MPPRESPLAERHAGRGATFTEFGGWTMPVEFDSIGHEHRAVRERVGVFDVSHMGEIEVSGPDATELMQRLTTNDVTALGGGDAQYSTVTDAEGTILDDTLVYRLPGESDEPSYLFVPNAGRDGAMYGRWIDHREEWDLDATVENATEEWAMLAVQGPDAPATVAAATDGVEPRDLARFEAAEAAVAGVEALVSRTGYTGEDGFEILCPWDRATEVDAAFDCQRCGLGARDTLRMEMGYLLAGHEFDPETEPRNPYEAGVGFTVNLEAEFVGRDALERVRAEGVEERLVGLTLLDRGVPRQGYEITDEEGRALGRVTSGTMSPTLEEPIGLGYLPTERADPGTDVRVVIREREKRARVVSLPFVDGK